MRIDFSVFQFFVFFVPDKHLHTPLIFIRGMFHSLYLTCVVNPHQGGRVVIMGRGLVAFRKETGKGAGATPVTIKYTSSCSRYISKS